MGKVIRLEKPTKFEYPQDPATKFALDVRDKKIVAGPGVRLECQRHLDDLETAEEQGIYWDPAAARRFYQFCKEVLFVKPERDGRPKKFILFPWQQFFTGMVFGWKWVSTGFRVHQRLYLETAKGSGKTPLEAAMALYCFVADGEVNPYIFIAAADKAQAGICFGDLVVMVESSPALMSRLNVFGGANAWKILTYKDKFPAHRQGAIYKIAGDRGSVGRGKSGFRQSFIAIDEYQQHINSTLVDELYANFKDRDQPILLITANAGTYANSACGIEHHAMMNMLKDPAERQRHRNWLPFICNLDEGDEPFEDSSCWEKANPSLRHGLPRMTYLEEQISIALTTPSKRNHVRRRNFSIWADAKAPAIDLQAWEDIQVDNLTLKKDGRRKAKCYLALDLSRTTDFSALAIIWVMENGTLEIEVIIWTPKDTLAERQKYDHQPYNLWVKKKHMRTSGKETIDYDDIAITIKDLVANNNVQGLTHDGRYIQEIFAAFRKEGLPFTEDPRGKGLFCFRHHQGKSRKYTRSDHDTRRDRKKTRYVDEIPLLCMPKSIDTFEDFLLDRMLKVKRNDALTSAWLAAEFDESKAGDRAFDKENLGGNRIDAAEAMVMGIGYAASPQPENGMSNAEKLRLLRG